MIILLSLLLYVWRLEVRFEGRRIRPPLQQHQGVLRRVRLLALEELVHPAAGLCMNYSGIGILKSNIKDINFFCTKKCHKVTKKIFLDHDILNLPKTIVRAHIDVPLNDGTSAL